MAKTWSLISFYIVLSLFLVIGVAGKPTGLTLTLIHADSPESPLFQGNLPYEERIRRRIQQSNARAYYLSSLSSTKSQNYSSPQSVHPEIVRPRIEVQTFVYMVRFGIGTFNTKPPYKEYYLDMDTGSSLTWTQCEGCTKCFKQTPNPFPKNASKSFRPILSSTGSYSNYTVAYADNTYSLGILAKETFYFNSHNSKTQKVENVTFGCGLKNDMEYGLVKNNKIAGIMGLGWDGPDQFVDRIGPQSDGKFSYCLPVIYFHTASRNSVSYLRFGADIPNRPYSGVTNLQRVKDKALYYLELQGISLNNRRLNISATVFALRGNGSTGGCIIDSGLGYSRIVKHAYEVLLKELENHFSRSKNLKRYYLNPLKLPLCYERDKPEGFKNLPTITFHFKGTRADMVIRPEGSFEVADKYNSNRKPEFFCLAMLSDNEKTVIGAHQQTNQRIIYDTKRKQLLFYPENCLKNA